jgi:hypothetical protein
MERLIGAPGGIRTPNPQIRSLVLCPIELRARVWNARFSRGKHNESKWRRERDLNPRYPFGVHTLSRRAP